MHDTKGKMREWVVEKIGDGIEIRHGALDGKHQVKTERIDQGKAGRSVEEQIHSRYLSRINKQKDKGYKTTVEEAAKGRTNSLGLKKPMLAKVFGKVKNVDYTSAFYQHKYNGHRCCVKNVDGKIVAYTRGSKLVKSISHILDGIEIPEGVTIDGELYCHGVALQTIGSWIKKDQPETKLLSLRVYDTISDQPYAFRLRKINDMILGAHAEVVPTGEIEEEGILRKMLTESITLGYEGGIVRWGFDGYEDGSRSKHLLKLKVADSAEFEVVDIVPSKDGWARLVLDCGVTVSCHGNMEYKYDIMNNADQYIGKILTIEYFGLTNDKKPFQPIAIAFRED